MKPASEATLNSVGNSVEATVGMVTVFNVGTDGAGGGVVDVFELELLPSQAVKLRVHNIVKEVN
ncbi:hypothetical protein GCM10007906_32940 [Vibrio hyugaensis]|uniref:Uncharacterized protein n=1 Tax=Vibrio hyugaensis TaxID=1534743 RepID=A0ABQ5Y427_9VIBR|nr:hypothetical protein GCM10007906_32940 [Vibrio hyugaensis]